MGINPLTKGKDFTLNSKEFKHSLKCALCWRGGMFEKGHAHTACPFLTAQNKLRKQNGLRPVVLSKGWVIRVDEAPEEDMRETMKAMRKEIDDLKLRLAVLESAEKRKAEEDVDEPTAKKAKKAKKEEEEKGAGTSTKGKGKGPSTKSYKGKSRN